MNRFRFLALAFVLTLACSAAAHADTMKTFNLSGSPSQGTGSLTGTITIDITKGSVVSDQFTFSGGSGSGVLFATQMSSYYYFYTSQLDMLKIMTKSLVNFTGGTFTLSNGCTGYIGDVTGQAVSAAATPEPSSIALLGTGLIGIAGMVRRRRESVQTA